MAILHLKLNHDANSLKHSLVILKNSFGRGISMAETLIKNLEVLDPGIEGFMTGFSSVLEFLDGWGVKWVSDTNLFWLTLIAFISDYPLVRRDLRSQSIQFSINRNVVLPCGKGTIDPHKFIATDSDA